MSSYRQRKKQERFHAEIAAETEVAMSLEGELRGLAGMLETQTGLGPDTAAVMRLSSYKSRCDRVAAELRRLAATVEDEHWHRRVEEKVDALRELIEASYVIKVRAEPLPPSPAPDPESILQRRMR
jgi:hypothetical protein